MSGMTPQATVRELDKYIVGQQEAKRAVAVALRNRQRRRLLPPEVRKEITPKNLLMIGPTGVGKTEEAPFIKVEATKFTEVGYVGRDVESIIHELVDGTVAQIQEERLREVQGKAERLANERLISYLCQQVTAGKRLAARARASAHRGEGEEASGRPARAKATQRQRVAELLQSQQLEDHIIEIEVDEEPEDGPPFDDEAGDAFYDFAEGYRPYGPRRRRRRRVPVREARRILTREEAQRLVDFDDVVDRALERVEENSVVFVDELDKLIGPTIEVGADVSGEGVQRDLLPLLEGTMVMTRYGPVKTDHILFIAAGAFYEHKPSELIPELQGRFPLRVELSSLTEEDLHRILVEPENALTRQYQALLATEGVEVVFTDDGIAEIARLAAIMNERTENIGARRLATIMERVLEELSYTASERQGERVVVDATYVSWHLGDLIKDEDLSRYIL